MPPLTLDVVSATITYGDCEVQITRQQAAIFHALSEAGGAALPIDDLAARIPPEGRPRDDDAAHVTNQVFRLRRRLRDAGVPDPIETVRAIPAYRLRDIAPRPAGATLAPHVTVLVKQLCRQASDYAALSGLAERIRQEMAHVW